MKIITLSHSDGAGGAGRAAYRIHKALRESAVDSKMLVKNSSKRDASVDCMRTNITSKILNRTAGVIGKLPVLALKTTNPILHSPAIVPTNLSSRLNASDADIVHLHWVNHDTFSIKDIGG